MLTDAEPSASAAWLRGTQPGKADRALRGQPPALTTGGATYFVTSRLTDAVPTAEQVRLRSLRQTWSDLPPEERQRLCFAEIERLLDQGHGECLLRASKNRAELTKSLRLAAKDSEVFAWVVMPNHFHLLIRPVERSLEEIVRAVRSGSSKRIRHRIGTDGPVWACEYHDRLVRDAEHLWRCIQCIGRNPTPLIRPDREAERWVREDWVAAGWDYRGEPR